MKTAQANTVGMLRAQGASLAAVALVVAATPLPQALAQDAGAKRNEATRQLESRKERLGEAERRAQGIQSELQMSRQEQAAINEKLIETGRLVQQTEGRMSQLEARLAQLESHEKAIRERLSRRHGELAKLFAAMQRMGRNPPPVIVTRREDALEMVRSAMLLARAFPQLKGQAEELSTQLEELVRVTTAIRTDSDRLKQESERLNEARRELALRMEAKRQSVVERQRELEEVRRAAAEISRGVTELSDLIGKLDKVEKAVAEHTTLGAYEREQQAVAASSPPASAPVAEPPSRPPQTAQTPGPQPAAPPQAKAAEPLRPSVADGAGDAAPGSPKSAAAGPRPTGPLVALEPKGSNVMNHGRMSPAVPFQQAKGHLPLPAQGRKLIAFGERTQFGATSKGVVIETRQGATITSPCDGWVVYAGEFRSYGQVLIINAGNGYHVLMANLSRIDVEVGRFVLAAEPVGTMSANLKGKGQDSAPVLYVEFRNKEGQPIDPDPWWVDGSQKVQG